MPCWTDVGDLLKWPSLLCDFMRGCFVILMSPAKQHALCHSGACNGKHKQWKA